MTVLATLAFSSSWWAAVGAPIANHLWQSTLFAGVAGLLTLLMRKNRAETRYSLWLIASAKFLLPFSLLIGMGSHLRWSTRPAIVRPSIFAVTQVIGQPFAAVNRSPVAAHASDSSLAAVLRSLPTLLLMVWSSGCAAVVFLWWRRRQRTVAALRGALSMQAGREFEMLRLLERNAAITRHIELKISESALEPGILGIFRPVLLLPAGISNRLSDAQLKAIITHELCHVQRRDNLAAALHMLVEAVFWFHPLVWWIGARLVDERERACDQEVLTLGSDPQAYAEGILKVCEFYVESPRFCAAGVTGSNLKKRIEAIMIDRSAQKLDLGRKLLLAATSVVTVLGPIGMGFAKPGPGGGQSQATPAAPPSFQDVSIKPSKSAPTDMTSLFLKKENQMRVLTATNRSVKSLIADAYGLHEFQISGGPDWISVERYDITAKMPDSLRGQVGPAFEKLITDRFRLAFHREAKVLPVYELVVSKNGPKLSPVTSSKNSESPPGHLVAHELTMRSLARWLADDMNRIVVDKTGLQGAFAFTLDWTPGSPKSLLTAISEQLGLELREQTGPVEMFIIDHAEKITGDESSQTQLEDQSAAESIAASMPPARVYEGVSIRPNHSTTALTPFMEFRPDGFTASNVTLQMLIQQAYRVEDYQIAGAPAWLDRDRYDVEAKVDDSLADELSKGEADRLSVEQQPMLFELLADRFLLSVHRETRELPVYVLVMAKNGSKLHEATPGDTYPNGIRDGLGKGHDDVVRMLRGQIIGQGISLDAFVQPLSQELDRTVLNRTGLTGKYDFTLQWSAGRILAREYIVPGAESKHVRLDPPPPTNTESCEFTGPSIFAALHDQLGLELVESHEQSSRAQILVVDRAEKPWEN